MRFSIELAIEKKKAEQKKTSTCGCDISVKKCACSSKSAPAKKAPAKSTEKKTAIKSDLADKPVAKKKPAPKKK
jgi:hypothetical protein